MVGKPNLVPENQLGQLWCLPSLSYTLYDEGSLKLLVARFAPSDGFLDVGSRLV
jgi:hypothetical protein